MAEQKYIINSSSTAFREIAFKGACKIAEKAESKWREAIDRWGADKPVGFPNTAYYLPIIYGISGMKVEKLGDMEAVLKKCKALLPTSIELERQLPYSRSMLGAGMTTLQAEEMMEAIRYLEYPDFYMRREGVTEDNIWFGAADDSMMKKMAIELIDGTAPGLAAVLGAAPTPEIAKNIAEELQKKNLHVFMAGESRDGRFAEHLAKAGVKTGWDTRLAPSGPDISALVFVFGLSTRAAIVFGGIEPGDYRKILNFGKERLPGFIITLGDLTDEWYANCAGAINWGFKIIADRTFEKIPASDINIRRHFISNISLNKIVSTAIDVRRMKVPVSAKSLPVAFGPEFEGERVRGDDIFFEAGGLTPMVEWVTTKAIGEVEDGKIEVIGLDLDKIQAGSRLPLAIIVEVAGRRMRGDYEPVLERQIHNLSNYAQGVMHTGRRDTAGLRVSQQAVAKGFRLRHIGDILYAGLQREFGRIIDKLQIKLYTEPVKVDEILKKARAVYKIRDARIEGMTDESVDTYYSCTICQSLAPSHVCIISPERTGLCGSYNWIDCMAAHEINPIGPHQPVRRGDVIDARLGQWKGVNEFVSRASGGTIDRYNVYSIVRDPVTTCNCCEAIAAVLPMCNGIMTVNREYDGETPCGMKFSTMTGTVGGGMSTPGFAGHAKYNTTQRKYFSAEGGLLRVVWMPGRLKKEIGERFKRRAAELGIPDLLDRVADETIGVTEEAIIPFLEEKDHPALKMEPILGA